MNKLSMIGFVTFAIFFVIDLYNVINGNTVLFGKEIGDWYYIHLFADIVLMFWFFKRID